jgi:hypothetical protein|tara:strand:+ start:10979 stop:11254 length:276 start_codon:yes stop_codon:yes gene_type:complete
MITALVHYTEWVEAPHPQLDDIQVAKSKVVKVEDLLELNELFSHITKVDVLDPDLELKTNSDEMCIIKDCTNKPYSLGYCFHHWNIANEDH